MLFNCLLVAVGGAAGCVARYLASLGAAAAFGTSFPFGTLAVNVVGCLAIGVIGRLAVGPTAVAEPWRLTLMVGFLGGLTTFSSFGLETFALAEAGRWGLAILYALASNVLGLAATAAGWWAAANLALA